MLTFLTTKYYQKISLNCNNITSFQRKALHTLQVCSFHTLRKMRWTYLIVPTRFIFIKRSMQITKYVVKNHVIPKSHTVLSPLTPKGSTRGMAAMYGGRLRKNSGQLLTSRGNQPEADVKGGHTIVVAAVCTKPGCKDQNCATGTQLSTGMTYPNPCGVSPQNHQQLPVSDPVITLELAGNATSRIPSNKKGIIVDPVEKINGDKQPQEFVIEKDKVPVSSTAVKENKKVLHISKKMKELMQLLMQCQQTLH
jgi:hypothetical protein